MKSNSCRICLTKCRSNVHAPHDGLMTTGQSQLKQNTARRLCSSTTNNIKTDRMRKLTWGGGAVTSAAQPSRGSGGRETAGLHWTEAPKAEACQGGSEGGVVHLRIPPPWSAKAEGGATRGPVAGCASTNHVLLKQSQVILESQKNSSRLQTTQHQMVQQASAVSTETSAAVYKASCVSCQCCVRLLSPTS